MKKSVVKKIDLIKVIKEKYSKVITGYGTQK